MTDIPLSSESLRCTVSTNGGAILRLEAIDGTRTFPLMRNPPGEILDARASAGFPLVPFGNRVAGNRFEFDGRAYQLAPNTAWDPHYLHGDGWRGAWQVARHDRSEVQLAFHHAGQPYAYRATQSFAIDGPSLTISLAVTNIGEAALPFGLGWHPSFPLTSSTTLTAPAKRHWTEKAGWLPDRMAPIPHELDFAGPRKLPRHWVNNGFEEWTGVAEINWPEPAIKLAITTEPRCSRYFLFVSDTRFDPEFPGDYFCFEPMTHSANAHNMPDLGGLTVLSSGDSLGLTMRLTWSRRG